VCAFVSESREVLHRAKQGMCSESERVRFLTQVQGGGGVAFVSAGIDTKANTRAAAHSKLVICVSLRTAVSAAAPWSPISLCLRLRARGGVGMVRE
jgi:hypothetical protein